MNLFERLSEINVNEHKEEKNGLSYLSWTWAWAEFKKACPDANYKVLPYEYDEKLGYMCHTELTAEGVTYEMWLPVMDSNNYAMLDHPYTIKTKYKEVTVKAATMFDINKTIMRCLVKNMAMFGLGLYIYAGEDLPESETEEVAPKEEKKSGEKKSEVKKEAPKTETKKTEVTKMNPPKTEEKPKQKHPRDQVVELAKKLGTTLVEVAQEFGLNKDTTTARFLTVKDELARRLEEAKEK